MTPMPEPRRQAGDLAQKSRRDRPFGSPGRRGCHPTKVTACLACKRMKVRCEPDPRLQKCRQCIRRNSNCVVRRVVIEHVNYEGHLADDTTPANNAVSDATLPFLAGAGCERQEIHAEWTEHQSQVQYRIDAMPSDETVLPLWDSRVDLECQTKDRCFPLPGGQTHAEYLVPMEEPESALYGVDDFIDRGIISIDTAAQLYNVFLNSLNQHLWLDLEDIHPSIDSMRRSSRLLTAAVLTVSAVHVPNLGGTMQACYKELQVLVSGSLNCPYPSTDDIRGLCVAASWIPRLSREACRCAVRIATQLGIDKSFPFAMDRDKEQLERARLWYVVYICDHNISLLYGQEPWATETDQIRLLYLYAASPFAKRKDADLLSQIELTRILSSRNRDRKPLVSRKQDRLDRHPLTRVGGLSDISEAYTNRLAAWASEPDLDWLTMLNLEIDNWSLRWHVKQLMNRAARAQTNIALHLDFAKLRMNYVAVSGLTAEPRNTPHREHAQLAVDAALSIIGAVLWDKEVQKAWFGATLYSYTMVAFACGVLMQGAINWRQEVVGIDVDTVSELLTMVAKMFSAMATSDQHMSRQISRRVEEMLVHLVLVPKGTNIDPSQESERSNNSKASLSGWCCSQSLHPAMSSEKQSTGLAGISPATIKYSGNAMEAFGVQGQSLPPLLLDPQTSIRSSLDDSQFFGDATDVLDFEADTLYNLYQV